MAEREWKLLLIPFKVLSEEKKVKIAFFIGGAKPQELQFANVTVFDFKKNYRFEDLPKSKTYYPGMELDAPWRAEADARIEKYRKATLDVTVKNAQGKTLKGANVHIEQLEHDFGFGAAISARVMFDDEKGDAEDQRMYKQRILESFNKVTIENGLKWKLFEHFEPFIQPTLDWCKENDLPVRGHVLVWPGYRRLPKAYDTYKTDPEQFKKDIEAHVRDFSTRWGDCFPEWDVMNEPYYQHDYSILAGNNFEHIENHHEWIQYLLDNNAPVQAIGFQSHFRSPVPPMEIWRRIQEFEKYGLEMQVTEFDFDDEDEELKVRFTEDVMMLIFSHPKFVGFVTWTITWHNTKYSGKKNATFYREDWSKKPVAELWDYLVKEKWHTELHEVSDGNGKLSFRGFKAKYRVTVEHNGSKKVQEIYLKKDGKGTLVLN